MEKVFFFYKKNVVTGETTDVIIDANEKVASAYYKNQRRFKYIGWSDGRFMKEFKKDMQPLEKDIRGIMVQPEKELQDKVKEVIAKEVEFAKNNPDKLPPKDFTRIGLTDKDREDPVLMNRIKSMRD